MVSTLEDFFRSLGLLWERLHIISADTVQTAGLTCQWTQDLVPIGDRAVAAGELVELRLTLTHDHPLADASKIRFDILKFDWLFSGGFDDPVVSLKTAAADPPSGAFTIIERVVSETEYSSDLPSLREVVESYRIRHGDDYERGVLVVREPDRPDTGRTEVITWWRAHHVDDTSPSLYFVSELPSLRDSSTVALHVAPPQPGVNLRLYGQLLDSDPPDADDAQPIPDAVITLLGHTGRTSAGGGFVLDVRLPVGRSAITVTRSGIDARTLAVTVAEREDKGYDLAVVDADAADAPLAAGVVAADADEQSAFAADLTLRARVHRVSGTVSWPQTWNPAAGPIPLADRFVYAVPLAAGAALPQRPKTSREWDALRTRAGVLRSAQPNRPTQREATAADGRFEISFLDLQPNSCYLLWVEGADPRAAGTYSTDVIVRTVAATSMRRMAFPHGPLSPDKIDRRVVDSTYNLLADDTSAATDVLRVVNVAAQGAAADRKLLRPGNADPAGIDASPPTGADIIDVNDATMRAGGLTLEVLPLLAVFEAASEQCEQARWATRTLHSQVDAQYPRGHLLAGTRWVLDARRGPSANWNDAAACAALETTLLTHPLLGSADLNNPDWGWWRADAVSAADFAGVTLAGGAFAGRRLVDELIPVLAAPVPRLLGLFGGRHVHISPGHGVFAQPSDGYSVHTNRSDWAGYQPGLIENWAGEDENTAAIAMQVRRVADANGVSITVSRESLDPTRPGLVQDAGQFAPVDVIAHPDHPRLWQQNAYYWIAAEWDPNHPGDEIVVGHAVTSAAALAIDGAGINTRLALHRWEALNGPQPVDAFIPVHTNGSPNVNRNGYDVMYLDVRHDINSPAPGAAGYQEQNTLGLDAATRLVAELAAEVEMHNLGAETYYQANGSIATELNSTVHHWRNSTAVQGIRSATAAANYVEIKFPPPAGGPDHPVAYIELGFHSNTGDAAYLAQGWFRFASGIGIARAVEAILGAHSSNVVGADAVALLTQAFGATPTVSGLVVPDIPTPADVGTAVSAVTRADGQPAAPPAATTKLADVVSLIEAEQNATTRTMLAQQVADAVATLAGYTADAGQADERSRASLGPVLRALGAPAIAAASVPVIGELPRGDKPPTRADAAAAVCGALGLRPGALATSAAPINGVTVLPAAAPEAPGAYLSGRTLTEMVAAIGTLRAQDAYRLAAARLTDARGNRRHPPYSVAPGEDIYLEIDTIGTAWRASAADISVLVTRAGNPVATLASATRTVDRLATVAWTVTAPGVAGEQRYDVSAQIKHPAKGVLRIGPVPLTMTVVAP